MQNLRKIIFGIFSGFCFGLFLFPLATWAAEKYECPGKITLRHELARKSKFKLFNPSGELKSDLEFSGILLFEGHPKEEASLAPDNGDADFPHRWSLKGKNFWLACQYQSDKGTSDYFIIQKLNKIYKECVQFRVGKPEIYRAVRCK